jgi:prolyl-tRNA editing enzyme YbaK/EbsC (Cys-tRNA(Pro) deacylase)
VSQVLMSRELLVHDRVWVGAGSERHMAGLSPVDLARLTQARSTDLT